MQKKQLCCLFFTSVKSKKWLPANSSLKSCSYHHLIIKMRTEDNCFHDKSTSLHRFWPWFPRFSLLWWFYVPRLRYRWKLSNPRDGTPRFDKQRLRVPLSSRPASHLFIPRAPYVDTQDSLVSVKSYRSESHMQRVSVSGMNYTVQDVFLYTCWAPMFHILHAPLKSGNDFFQLVLGIQQYFPRMTVVISVCVLASQTSPCFACVSQSIVHVSLEVPHTLILLFMKSLLWPWTSEIMWVRARYCWMKASHCWACWKKKWRRWWQLLKLHQRTCCINESFNTNQKRSHKQET